ncbi:hypothetical protein ABZ912_05190 [Nonomuraea angiospora]|uniref:hypothetical protein n=1 Tax=Nonomuraea angiospora TaxID=46172 RepID=UPI00340A8109
MPSPKAPRPYRPLANFLFLLLSIFFLMASAYLGTTGLEWAAVATAILAFFSLALMVRAEGNQRIAQAAEDPRERLRQRAQVVTEAVSEAAKLMDELRRDLEAQQAAREALVAQAEEQQRLLEINQEQAEKIRHILIGETKATIRAEQRQQWMFFALGVVVSIPIGVMINILVP